MLGIPRERDGFCMRTAVDDFILKKHSKDNQEERLQISCKLTINHSINKAFNSGILLVDFPICLINPLILSPLTSGIVCIMLGCDRDEVHLAYKTVPKQFQQSTTDSDQDSFGDEGESLVNNYRWLSEFCTKSIPTRAVLLTNLDGFNHKEQFLVNTIMIMVNSVCVGRVQMDKIADLEPFGLLHDHKVFRSSRCYRLPYPDYLQ